MSVEEIVRYVRQTPGNTNPSVVGSMVNAEMNSTLKTAKEYTDSQRLGYEEKTVITWDGDITGKTLFPGEIGYACKISDTPIDYSSTMLKRIELTMVINDNKFSSDINFEKLQIYDLPEIGMWGVVQGDYTEDFYGVTFFSVVYGDNEILSKGIYLLYANDDKGTAYVSLVEYETIRQIDPKFIPGVTLPVINYEDYFNFDFISAIMAGAIAGVDGPFFIDNLVKPEFAENFTPTTPVVVIKIKATQEDITADIYCFARACFNNGDPTLIRINDSFYYNGSIVNFDIYALAHGAGFTQIKAQNVTYPD